MGEMGKVERQALARMALRSRVFEMVKAGDVRGKLITRLVRKARSRAARRAQRPTSMTVPHGYHIDPTRGCIVEGRLIRPPWRPFAGRRAA